MVVVCGCFGLLDGGPCWWPELLGLRVSVVCEAGVLDGGWDGFAVRFSACIGGLGFWCLFRACFAVWVFVFQVSGPSPFVWVRFFLGVCWCLTNLWVNFFFFLKKRK